MARRNRDFLLRIDTGYFEHIGDVNAPALESEDKHRAALTLRAAYSQALETLFALLFGVVQAPRCIFAYLLKYKAGDLRKLIEDLEQGVPVVGPYRERPSSWDELSSLIHANCRFDGDGVDRDQVVEGFARMWRRMSADFMSDIQWAEYNSIKHGLRMAAGGFELRVAEETEPGISPPQEAFKTVGSHVFGSSFIVDEELAGKKHHFRVVDHACNWEPENYVDGLAMISASLRNLVSFSRWLSGDTGELRYAYPTEMSSFEAPWSRVVSITNMRMDLDPIGEVHIQPISKDEVLAIASRQVEDGTQAVLDEPGT